MAHPFLTPGHLGHAFPSGLAPTPTTPRNKCPTQITAGPDLGCSESPKKKKEARIILFHFPTALYSQPLVRRKQGSRGITERTLLNHVSNYLDYKCRN